MALTRAEGTAIESREAVETPANSWRWVYTARAAVGTGTTVQIAVTVTDRPGPSTMLPSTALGTGRTGSRRRLKLEFLL